MDNGIVAVTKAAGTYPVDTKIKFNTVKTPTVQKIMSLWGYNSDQYSLALASDFVGQPDHIINNPEKMAFGE